MAIAPGRAGSPIPGPVPARRSRWRRPSPTSSPKGASSIGPGFPCGQGTPSSELSEAYAQLFERVRRSANPSPRRLRSSSRTGQRRPRRTRRSSPWNGSWRSLIAPLAAQDPVLLIVLDGMSAAVVRELLTDITRHDWVPLCREGQDATLQPGPGGHPLGHRGVPDQPALRQAGRGSSAEERTGFAEHPAPGGPVPERPSARSCSTSPRSEEEGDAVLAGDVREEIASPNRRVVGVVINAVDDQLLKGEQIDTRWTRDAIPVLPAMLHEAQAGASPGGAHERPRPHAGLEDAGAGRRGGRAVAHRPAGTPEPGEILADQRAPRVILPESKTLIAPWTERVRYGVKKNGYHGGATPRRWSSRSPCSVLRIPVPGRMGRDPGRHAGLVGGSARGPEERGEPSPAVETARKSRPIESPVRPGSGRRDAGRTSPDPTSHRRSALAARPCRFAGLRRSRKPRRAGRAFGRNPGPTSWTRFGPAWREDDLGGALPHAELPGDAAPRPAGGDAAGPEHRRVRGA